MSTKVCRCDRGSPPGPCAGDIWPAISPQPRRSPRRGITGSQGTHYQSDRLTESGEVVN